MSRASQCIARLNERWRASIASGARCRAASRRSWAGPWQDHAGGHAEPLDRARLHGRQRKSFVREEDRERRARELRAAARRSRKPARRRSVVESWAVVTSRYVRSTCGRIDRTSASILADQIHDGEASVLAEPAERFAEAERLDALEQSAVGRQADAP